MTTAQDPPLAGDDQPATAPQEVVPFGEPGEREVTLRALSVDGPDGTDLKIEVESKGLDNPGTLALLYVINLPEAQNPLTAALKAVGDNDPVDEVMRECLAVFADYVGFPLPDGYALPGSEDGE